MIRHLAEGCRNSQGERSLPEREPFSNESSHRLESFNRLETSDDADTSTTRRRREIQHVVHVHETNQHEGGACGNCQVYMYVYMYTDKCA